MESIKKFLSNFMIAVSNCSLYSREHISFKEMTRKAFEVLSELITDRLEIMIVSNNLLINKKPVNDPIHGTHLMRRLKRKGIARIDFMQGITLSEIQQFIVDLLKSDKMPDTYLHIVTGAIDVRTVDDTESDFDINNLPKFNAGQIKRLEEFYAGFSASGDMNFGWLERIVLNYTAAIKNKANIYELLCSAKSFEEYEYTHAANVAVLSMFQAESLGLMADLLDDIGTAAILHDAGKIFIRKDIQNKKGPLDSKDWEEIEHHPLYGARRLIKIEKLTRIAPIVAFEHHMKYDGTGYPKLETGGRTQHICSWIVAISDYFDALRSIRPYRSALETEEILALMKKEAGTSFNPALLDNFTQKMLMSKSAHTAG